MKGVLILFIALFTSNSLLAQRKRVKDSVEVVIRLTSRTDAPFTDSVLVVFDRYDHRAAGVVKKVYYPVNNEIHIGKVPSARYYIGVYCLGTREQFSELTFVNHRRSNILTYRVRPSDTFTPGLAIIPVEPVRLDKLEILKEHKQ